MEEDHCKKQFNLTKFYFSVWVASVSLTAVVLLATQLGSVQMFNRLQSYKTAASVLPALMALSSKPIWALWVVLLLAALGVFLWSLVGVYYQIRIEEFRKAIYKICTF